MKNFKNIKWILKKQIDLKSNAKWAWIKKDEEKEEFICVYEIIPKESENLFTATQLLDKLTSDS